MKFALLFCIVVDGGMAVDIMMKKKILPALFGLLLVPSAAFFAAYLLAARESYDCRDICRQPTITDDGFAYVAYNRNGRNGCNSRPEILKLDPGGEVADLYPGVRTPLESGAETAYISGLYNCGGTVFAVENRADGTTGRVLRQIIYKLDENLPLSHFFTYQGGSSPKISYLTANGGSLYVTLLDGDGQKAFVDVFDLTGEAPPAPAESMEFSSPFNDRFYSALYCNNSLYASTKSGELLRCFGGGSVNVLNNPARDHNPCGIIEALSADENGVFFYEAMDGFIYDIDLTGKLRRRHSPPAGYGGRVYALAESGAYILVLAANGESRVMRISFDGSVTAELARLQLSPALIAKKSVPCAVFYTIAATAALLLIFFIINMFKRSQKLFIKFLFIATPLILLVFAGFGFSQYARLQDMLLSGRDSLSRYYNRLAADSIPAGGLDFIKEPQSYKSGEYNRLRDKLRADYNGDEYGLTVKNDVFIIRDGAALAVVSSDYPCLFPAVDLLAADVTGLLNDCVNTGQTVTGMARDWDGGWSVTVSAVKNDDGRTAGYVMTRVSQNDIAVMLNANRAGFTRLALMMILPLPALLTLIFKLTLRPVKKLCNAVREVTAGNYEIRLACDSQDEFRGVNLAFNQMCLDLKARACELERVSDSYYRFIPRNILPVLGKKSILDVDYGDSKRFSACCCVLCVHNLSDLRAAGTDEDFLEYMGMFSSLITGSLKRCGGVLMSAEIDLRGLLAIFPSPAEDDPPAEEHSMENPSAEGGMAFAADVRRFCSMEYAKFGGVSPKITVIIHKTGMLYGITGINDDAFPFLASDGVDFIMRAAPLFENTLTQTVLTQDILPGLADAQVMEIGWRETPNGGRCRLYIPRDGASSTAAGFLKGLDRFYANDFYNARALFSAVWRDEPENGIARWYALASDKYLLYPQQFVSSQLFGTDLHRIDL